MSSIEERVKKIVAEQLGNATCTQWRLPEIDVKKGGIING
jgi:acyl carrier protein